MLFDIGWPELLLIGVVALVVIGPKDLPRALRIAGVWVRKARSLSREFQSNIDQMIREAELEEVREELKKATDFDIEKEVRNTIDPTGELAETIKPPDLPDYFEEAEGPQPAAAQGELALPAPTETALPEQAVVGESMAEPAAAAASTPEPPAEPAAPPEPSIGAPAPGDEPASPRP